MAEMDDKLHELVELLDLLREERATQEQCDRIEAIAMSDPKAMQIYLRYMAMAASLRHRMQGLPGLLESAVGLGRTDAGAVAHAGLRRPTTRHWLAAATALAAVIALTVIFWSGGRTPVAPPGVPTVLATLSQVTGEVRLITLQGETPAAPATKLYAGDTIKTIGAGSSVILLYDDGTRLALANDASLTCLTGERKNVVLHHGIVSAQVAPQSPGKPMLLATPGAKIEVLGTQFTVAAGIERTELNVSQGRVRLTRVSDGQSVEVAQGHGVVTNGEITLAVHESKGPRETWEVDFEKGVPQGWIGAAEKERLPAGSVAAIRAVRDKASDPVIFLLASRDEWVQGLFAIHGDSHLHITFKMERPDWLNVFFTTRGSDPTNPSWTLHNFNEFPFFPLKPDQWQTVTIPLTTFRRKRDGVFHNEPPVVGEVATGISMSSTEPDRGLVVDRMWVTRGGPGKVEVKPAE
ncbi:MAG: FecR domain-containing protein [Phycisphaeraceae bacterium]